jgi:hypothetical protein
VIFSLGVRRGVGRSLIYGRRRMSQKKLLSAKHSAAVNTVMKNRWSILSGTRSSARIARGLRRGYTASTWPSIPLRTELS